MNPLLDSKNQFLGSLSPSMGMKTTTASTTQKTGLTSPVVSAAPAATAPLVTKPVVTTPKQAFVASASTGSPAPVVPPPQTPSNITTGNVTTPSGAVVNSGTGGLVTAPPVDQNLRTNDAFDAYLKTLMPSDEENSANTFLKSLMLQQQKDQETALGRGETLGFATGEAARVNKNNAFQIDAAANAVDALSGRRSAMGTVAKARFDYEQSLKKDEKSDGVTLSPGQKRYEYDKATKTYKEVASASAKENDPLDDEYRRAQIRNIESEIAKRNKDTKDGSKYTIPSAARNSLLKYGLKDTEVSALEQDIRDYGLSKALEGVDSDTRLYITSELDKQYLAQ